MGIIERISQYKADLRKKKDKKLALQAKQAEKDIKHEKFVTASRQKVAEAKKLKKENSFLHRAAKKGQEVASKIQKAAQKRKGYSRSAFKSSYSDNTADNVRSAISIGGKKKKQYDPFNL